MPCHGARYAAITRSCRHFAVAPLPLLIQIRAAFRHLRHYAIAMPLRQLMLLPLPLLSLISHHATLMMLLRRRQPLLLRLPLLLAFAYAEFRTCIMARHSAQYTVATMMLDFFMLSLLPLPPCRC